MTAKVSGLNLAIEKYKEQYSSQPKVKAFIELTESGLVSVEDAHVFFELEQNDSESIKDTVMNFFKGGKKDKEEKKLDDNPNVGDNAEENTESSEKTDSKSTDKTAQKNETDTKTTKDSKEKKLKITSEKVKLTVDVKYETIEPMSLKHKEISLKRLLEMDLDDLKRRNHEEARNTLEAFLYSTKEFLYDDELELVTTEEQRDTLKNLLEITSDWLFDDGEGAQTDEIRGKHEALKSLYSPMVFRRKEMRKRPDAVKELREAISNMRSTVNILKESNVQSGSTESSSSSITSSSTATPSIYGEALYSEEDFETVLEIIKLAEDWLNDKEAEQSKLLNHEMPVLKVKDLESKMKDVNMAVNILLSKPKPRKKASSSVKKSTTKVEKQATSNPETSQTDPPQVKTEETSFEKSTSTGVVETPAHDEFIIGSKSLQQSNSDILTAPDDTDKSYSHYVEHNSYLLRYTTSSLNKFFSLFLGPGTSPSARILLRRFWKLWFNMGAIFGVLALLSSVVFLLGCVFGWLANINVGIWAFLWGSTVKKEGEKVWLGTDRGSYSMRYSTGPLLDQPGVGKDVLVALIPGVNLPVHALGYYFLAMLVSGIFHELGHAIAAVIENVPIQSCGIFLFVLYPGAFVDLYAPALALLPPHRKLRIVTAGVWHNVTLGLAAWICLRTLPWWLAWGYEQRSEVVVLDDSSLSGHLFPGNIISWPNPVGKGLDAWEAGLSVSIKDVTTLVQGYCIPANTELEYDSRCCDVSPSHPLGVTGYTKQCFRPRTYIQIGDSGNATRCAKLHDTIGMKKCDKNTECEDGCWSMWVPDSNVRVVRLRVWDGREREVTFLGDPRELWEQGLYLSFFLNMVINSSEKVRVGGLIPSWGLLVYLPYVIERFILSISLALSFVNMVPAQFLDGHHALIALVNIIWDRLGGMNFGATSVRLIRSEKAKLRFVDVIVKGCTIVLALVMAVGAINAFLG
ncbi:Membrane-bound transcription factor site-2 protease [Nowakowskiella sp. JEL0078]|nr:Membrane-bound transcription factor site-2 protease [Nowakowskiella sp. JEL0078]